MFDNDLYNGYSSYTQTEDDEQQTNTQVTYDSPYSSNMTTSSYDSDYDDDYSVTPNYTEQQTYDSTTNSFNQNQEETEIKRYRKMEVPTVEVQETVKLTKTRERITLQPRMKIAIAMFSIIMCSLLFVIVWNFIAVRNLNAIIAGKQITINQLTNDINQANVEYSELEAQLKAEIDQKYSKMDSTNSFNEEVKNIFVEETVEKLPSNWFNDVCDFLSGLFS